jgi:ribosome modulation factor
MLKAMWFWIVIAVIAFLFFLSGQETSASKAHKDGYRHYHCEVPAEANPYRYETESRAWLEGWLKARNGGPEPK